MRRSPGPRRAVRSVTCLAVVALTLGACGASAAQPASTPSGSSSSASISPTGPCGPATATTLVRDGRARVYASGGQVYGCAAGGSPARLLGARRSCLRGARAAPFALSGVRVAYGLQRCGVDTGSSTLVVRQLDTGQMLISRSAVSHAVGPESYSTITAIVLSPSGGVAWVASAASIVGHRRLTEVQAVDRRGARVLDTGPQIVASTLALSGGRVRWRDGSSRRSAALR